MARSTRTPDSDDTEAVAPDATGAADDPAEDGASVTDAAPEGGDEARGAAIPDDIAALGYEEARDELVRIVAQLESGQRGLEESMALWERGEALAAHCSRWLDDAQQRIGRSTRQA